MNPQFMRYKKIVFTPRVEFPQYSTETDSDYCDSWYSTERIRVASETHITLSDRDWNWTVKLIPSERYQKVAAIVGPDLAEKVLTVLGEK